MCTKLAKKVQIVYRKRTKEYILYTRLFSLILGGLYHIMLKYTSTPNHEKMNGLLPENEDGLPRIGLINCLFSEYPDTHEPSPSV